MTLKIAHITDIHIVAREGDLLRGIDVRNNFIQTLNTVRNAQPDMIVVGGDMAAEDGELAAYQWIKMQLDRMGIEYHVLAGNHDRIENMHRVFHQSGRQNRDTWYFQLDRKGRRIFCLDSSTNRLSKDQLDWLKADIGKRNDTVLLFIHHPPLLCDCLFMDRKYPLENWQEAVRLLRSIPQIKNIVCGHYHTERTVQSCENTVFITPATYMQISQQSPNFEISDYRPGWRWIKWEGETLYSSVFYAR